MTSFYDKFETDSNETLKDSNETLKDSNETLKDSSEETYYYINENSEYFLNIQKKIALTNMHYEIYNKWDSGEYNLFMMGYINYYKTIIRYPKYYSYAITSIFEEYNEYIYYSQNTEKFDNMISYYIECGILIPQKTAVLNNNEKEKENCERLLSKGWNKARADLNIPKNIDNIIRFGEK